MSVKATGHSLTFLQRLIPQTTFGQNFFSPDLLLCPLLFGRSKNPSGSMPGVPDVVPHLAPQGRAGEVSPGPRGGGDQSHSRRNKGCAQALSSPTAQVPPGGQHEGQPPPDTQQGELSGTAKGTLEMLTSGCPALKWHNQCNSAVTGSLLL